MEKKEIEELRGRVRCHAVLEQAGFAVDVKESTRRAVKFRRNNEIIIVIHDGHGWFDPLSDARGDVFSLVAHLDGIGFPNAFRRVASMIGYVPREPTWNKPARAHAPDLGVRQRWDRRRKPWPGSSTWRYLSSERLLPEMVIRAAIRQDLLREGPHGSMWAVHLDGSGRITGWEERGPQWRGFSARGTKILFRLGPAEASRFCVTEAAIDAMSLAAIEGLRNDTLYLSTGGGWSPATDAALRLLADRPSARLVAATDANAQGEVFAARLRAMAEELGCAWQRLRPTENDWNDVLKQRTKEKERRRGTPMPSAHRSRQG